MKNATDKTHIAHAVLEPWPLDPSLVIDGAPEARGAWLGRSSDGLQAHGIWHSTPGCFRWTWSCDETVFVVQGRATVELSDGRRVELAAGDMAFFERGLESVWTIHETLRKGFHLASPEPLAA